MSRPRIEISIRDRICEDYRNGDRVTDIARRYGVSHTSVSTVARDNGMSRQPKSNNGHGPRFPREHKRAAIERYNAAVEQGKSFSAAARIAGHQKSVLAQWASGLGMNLLSADDRRDPWEFMELCCWGDNGIPGARSSEIEARSLSSGKVSRRTG